MGALALVATGFLGGGAILSGCGTATEVVCGNGLKEEGEDCDRGTGLNGAAGSNCNAECKSVSVLIPQVQVQWGLLRKSGVDGYGGAACGDVGAKTARVQLSGPTNADETVDYVSTTTYTKSRV